ncbi:hypothetical protein LAZ67_16000539 [Cordylochernes scorpioides]|uniref:Transposase n=1 Tax=Cordylochernes scorpioides TaxID=51811 RepID=A0ABY6LAP9_9ARAC|nr:hypothetical protein LAZ67_16000539 [Cordylochernes scorpioides]
MERSLEQRYAIKFCVRLGKNATETFQMLQKAFKDHCISRSQSGKWHKAFKEGRKEVADEPRSGRPTTARTDENVDRVLKVLRTDRRLSIQQIDDTLHMSTFVVHGIVTEDLQMRKVCAKLLPKVLTQDQKELRVLRCQELLDLIQNEPDFLNSVVTGNESWMFEYDPESKRQSCAWHTKSSPRPKKARMSKSRIKTMIIVFLDIRGIVHCCKFIGKNIEQHEKDIAIHYPLICEKLKFETSIQNGNENNLKNQNNICLEKIEKLEQKIESDRQQISELKDQQIKTNTIIESLSESNNLLKQENKTLLEEISSIQPSIEKVKKELNIVKASTQDANLTLSEFINIINLKTREFEDKFQEKSQELLQSQKENEKDIIDLGIHTKLKLQSLTLDFDLLKDSFEELQKENEEFKEILSKLIELPLNQTLPTSNPSHSADKTVNDPETLDKSMLSQSLQQSKSISNIHETLEKKPDSKANVPIANNSLTISRRLVANGLHSCRPLRRLPLTPPNRRQRLEWCRARSTWMTEWHRVVFSDESRFCLSSDSRRVRVWRRRGERSNPAAIVERPTVRQRGIMVWGAIAYDSRSPLLRIQGTMTAQRYVDDVLRPVTLPYLQGVPNALYQQDNARPHTARISQQALQDVQMLPWPPYSPDLSPIEHVWDIIGRRLHALPQPCSEDELWQMVEREWRAIPQDAIRTLIDSLPRRVAACIAVRGGPTCY